MMARPLEGIIVTSLEQAVAAPFATRQLADWGARVIKVERPQSGDFARHYDQTVGGLSSHFVWINRGKESITLDLQSHEGRAILEKLLEHSDVLVQNLRPGSMEKWGMNSETLRTRFPRLICCNISGYGSDGPYRERKAYDLLIQAESGLLSITGTGETPVKVGVSIADIAAGMYALSGILIAVLNRERTHEGTVIEISMLEALAEWMGYPLNFGHFSGQAPPRTAAHHATIAPYGPYRVAQGREVFLGVQNEREWVAFCDKVIQKRELAKDARFANNTLRVSNRAALNQEIDEALSSLTMEQALARLEKAGIAYATLNTVEDLWAHPQLQARNRWRTVSTEGGPIEALMPPINFWGIDPVMGSVPALGEQTEAILTELGYSQNAIRTLRTQGVV